MPWNKKDYPPQWDQIRARVLDRAGNRCEGSPKNPDCRLLNGSVIKREKDGSAREPSPQEWDMIYNRIKYSGSNMSESIKHFGFIRVVLTIAHLNHDKDNWDVKDEELKAWCQKCHLDYDRARHTENRKYGRNHRKTNLRIDF